MQEIFYESEFMMSYWKLDWRAVIDGVAAVAAVSQFDPM
jgi:hypothetical protein